MSSEYLEALPLPPFEMTAAGTLVQNEDNNSKDSLVSNASSTSQDDTGRTTYKEVAEEQALETHEVIELQTFSERKAWIEEKIKFLESMPPIEVFVGLDAIRSSAEEIPGLPTRAELQQLLDEHDTIEKQTEIFDSGELKKLRKLTKAATQRHLSPADTDLIELTLTTIYELDKLLHLLRDRSDNLDLLGTRLTWEEHRITSWVDRRKILTDLHSFLETRARWSPSAYESSAMPEAPLTRRGSIASMVSMASGDSSLSASTSSPAFSRSARFKLAELLSRDAAQFAGRVSTLRHSKITAAGKALDKLIDNSRKPVPEELLDEQDRLEEKGISDMEAVGKFVMNVVMQWRKADEIYVETMKDQVAAQNLLDEIETATFYHPTPRQSTAFVSRADALRKRLILRGDPILSSSSTFPCPAHPLFPDQPSSNEALALSLSSEIATAFELVKKADGVAKEYRATLEAVKDVEALSQTSKELLATFKSLQDRLSNGVSSGEVDGSPPDLTSKICLQPTRHSAFLTFLPDVLKESDAADDKTTPLLRAYRAAVLRLDHPGIDPSFKSDAITEINQLGQQRDQTLRLKGDVVGRTKRLREARKIWDTMELALKSLDDTRRKVGDSMERNRWKQQAPSSGAPLTPESPIPALPTPSISPISVLQRLDSIQSMLSKEVAIPLSSLSTSLEPPLHDWLSQSFTGLTSVLDSLKQMTRLLEAIQHQASVMGAVQNDVQDFQIRIEDLKIRFDASFKNALVDNLTGEDLLATEASLKTDAKLLRDSTQMFIDSLSQRVPFVAQRGLPSQPRPNFIRRRFASMDIKLGDTSHNTPIELPFDLVSVDDAVRMDSNSYVMRLAGELQGLDTKGNHLHLVQMAKQLDVALSSTVNNIQSVMLRIGALRVSLSTISASSSENESIVEPLQLLLKETDDFLEEYRPHISRSFSPIRELLSRMGAAPGCRDSAIYESLYIARTRAVDDAELKLKACHEDISSLKSSIVSAQRAEGERLEAQRVEQERLEKERLEKERLEKERLERERLEREVIEKARLEKIRLDNERLGREILEQERMEKERLEQEQLERERLEQERLEKERLEKERLEKERLEQAEEKQKQERLEKERMEQVRLEKERMEQARLEKERMEQVRLEKERMEQVRLEKERLDQEQLERDRMEQERMNKERLEQERLERERLEQARLEQERIEKEKLERKQEQVEQERLAKEQMEHLAENELLAKRKEEADTHVRKLKESLQAEADDVFTLNVVSTSTDDARMRTINELKARVLELRRRLRSISINELAKPSISSVDHLPSQEQWKKKNLLFSSITTDVARLPSLSEDSIADAELRSLRAEVEASAELMQLVRDLADMSTSAQLCDQAFSDLLEHIDSYPSPPMGSLVSAHATKLRLPPEEQLAARLSFTRSAVAEMKSKFASVAYDSRAITEKNRVEQTWGELEDMANDIDGGKRSRPSSVISSGRSSRASISSSHSATKSSGSDKRDGYSNLSVRSSARGPSTRGRYLSPAHPVSRRAFSGSSDTPSRSTSRLSTVSSARSVSGPGSSSSAKPLTSTFASRQRVSSLSSNASSFATPMRSNVGTPSRPRAQTGQTKRTVSPTFSDGSSMSNSHSRSYSLSNSRSQGPPARSTSSMSTWSRAPRQSLPLPTFQTPPRKSAQPKKTYIANPKNKLDVAVGDVVNKLPVNINISLVPETWNDQSGKYWIGEQEPKLCFCRILRSRTVMIRVGGGWVELSQFIKTHFADLFRLMPVDSPPRPGAQDEKWINSSTLLEASETPNEPPEPPRTPEPKGPLLPSFSLSTPGGQSPRSLRSTPSSSSPLTALQFMRRAEPDSPGLRPISPSRPPTRVRHTAPNTPSRHSVWRP